MNTELMFSSASNEWETPDTFFQQLDQEFHFTLDPCCQAYSHKCKKYYTSEMDGLSRSWAGERVFCNPPYGREIGNWVRKCYEEAQNPNTTVVMLVPARTDTRWFHNYIYQKKNVEIRFLKGRLKFINRCLSSDNPTGNFQTQSAPFPSMVVIFR